VQQAATDFLQKTLTQNSRPARLAKQAWLDELAVNFPRWARVTSEVLDNSVLRSLVISYHHRGYSSTMVMIRRLAGYEPF
jgi:hypothetical protein